MLMVAVVLGIVEGLTEFIPVSSTGHLILASSLLGFEGKRAETFEVFIQLGAILSVVWEYRARLWRMTVGFVNGGESRTFGLKLLWAFLPAAFVGLFVHDYISEHLFTPGTVAAALIVGAILILVIEGMHLEVRTRGVESVTWTQAFLIGAAQCLSLWPGFSRSAATILGGLTVGLDRRSAVEFSFFLAIPTMFAATLYSLAKNWSHLESGDLAWLALTFVISFFVAWASIRWLLHFVSNHSFRIFAWYRIVVGAVVLLVLAR
jgi:undecaprenyl-diphosphatase